MFASPAIHIFSQENADTAPKKPGATTTLSRKPFIDRTVNGTSPDIGRNNLKSEPKKPEFKTEEQLNVPKLNTEDDDLFFYDRYSYKDMEDNYLDIKCLTKKDIYIGLSTYYNCNNLNESLQELPTDFDIFADLPLKYENFAEDSELLEESVEDISLPTVDLD